MYKREKEKKHWKQKQKQNKGRANQLKAKKLKEMNGVWRIQKNKNLKHLKFEEEDFQAATARFDEEESEESEEERQYLHEVVGKKMQGEVCLIQEDNPQSFALGDSGSSHVMLD